MKLSVSGRADRCSAMQGRVFRNYLYASRLMRGADFRIGSTLWNSAGQVSA
jgi:hypothetical protein